MSEILTDRSIGIPQSSIAQINCEWTLGGLAAPRLSVACPKTGHRAKHGKGRVHEGGSVHKE